MGTETCVDTELKKKRDEAIARYCYVNGKIDSYYVKHGGYPPNYEYGGKYKDLYLHPDYFDEWQGTFYDKERFWLSTILWDVLSLSDYLSLREEIMSVDASLYNTEPVDRTIIGYCDTVRGSDKGCVIHLVDPHGEVVLSPFYGVPSSQGVAFVGKMLLVTLEFNFGYEPFITEVVALPFSLTERLQ